MYIATQVGSASHRLLCPDLVRLLPHLGSFLPGQFLPPMGVSPTPRVPERRLPGGHRVQGYWIGVEGIQSHQDILYRNLTIHTNYPVRIPQGLRQRLINRATPHLFLPLPHTASTARAIPIPPPPVSLPRTTPLQTRRTTSTIRTNRITPRRTPMRTTTNLSNRPISING